MMTDRGALLGVTAAMMRRLPALDARRVTDPLRRSAPVGSLPARDVIAAYRERLRRDAQRLKPRLSHVTHEQQPRDDDGGVVMPNLPVRRERREALPARWDPVREMEDMRERMDRLVEQVLGGAPLAGAGVWSPPVDLEETDDAWIVEADLPGVKQGDVSVEVRDNELAIQGEVKERERAGVLRRRTRRIGQFDYRVTLPGEVDAEHIDAQLADGVLTLRIPKPERAKPRRIEVKGG